MWNAILDAAKLRNKNRAEKMTVIQIMRIKSDPVLDPSRNILVSLAPVALPLRLLSI